MSAERSCITSSSAAFAAPSEQHSSAACAAWRLGDSMQQQQTAAAAPQRTAADGSSCWQRLHDTAARSSSSSSEYIKRRVVVTHSDGRQDVLEVVVPLEAADDAELIKTVLTARGERDVRFVYLTDRPPNESYAPLPKQISYRHSRPSAAPGVLPGTAGIRCVRAVLMPVLRESPLSCTTSCVSVP